MWGKKTFSRYREEGSQAVGPACISAVKPHGSARPKTGSRPSGCCRGLLRAWGQWDQYPGKTLVAEKLGIPDPRRGKVTKPKIDPVVPDPRGLRLGRNAVEFVASVDPFSPLEVSLCGKPPFSKNGVGEGGLKGWDLDAYQQLNLVGAPGLRLGRNPLDDVEGSLGHGSRGSVSLENPSYQEIGDIGP